MQEFHIGPQEAGQRFDKYLKKLLPEASQGFIYKMLRKKNFTLNGMKAAGSELLAEKDEVRLFLSEETFQKFSGSARRQGEYGALCSLQAPQPQDARENAGASGHGRAFPDIVYEDDDILIVNKPSGMLSQKAAPDDISANEYILSYLIRTGGLTEAQLRTFRPSVCNRLDRNTSGLLIAGKTLKGLQEMSAALKSRSVQKYYRCIVAGEVTEQAHISGWLVKDPRTNRVTVSGQAPGAGSAGGSCADTESGRGGAWAQGRHPAAVRAQNPQPKPQRIETEYRPIASGNGYTELEIRLITGRSHQIRAQLAAAGHPVAGDPKYGLPVSRRAEKELHVTSQLLHAYRLVFADGRTVTAPLPAEYEAALKYLKPS